MDRRYGYGTVPELRPTCPFYRNRKGRDMDVDYMPEHDRSPNNCLLKKQAQPFIFCMLRRKLAGKELVRSAYPDVYEFRKHI